MGIQPCGLAYVYIRTCIKTEMQTSTTVKKKGEKELARQFSVNYIKMNCENKQINNVNIRILDYSRELA